LDSAITQMNSWKRSSSFRFSIEERFPEYSKTFPVDHFQSLLDACPLFDKHKLMNELKTLGRFTKKFGVPSEIPSRFRPGWTIGSTDQSF
jgi:hypothetical protein